MRYLPPLNPLRAFEAAARHMSFTKAAEELHVTQAAISHQVKALEEYLGVPLFFRLTRKLLLTRQGEVLLPVVRDAFDRIGVVSEGLRSRAVRKTLTVRLPPYFSAKWLAPRLGRFVQLHPQVDLRLSHSVQPVDFSRDDVDIAVRWGDQDRPEVQVEPLLKMRRIPMCNPALLDGSNSIREPADLRHYTLLHEFDYEDWIQWFAVADIHDIDPTRGLVVDNYDVLIQSAIDGQGIALIMFPLFADHLKTRQLMMPLGDRVTIDFVYYLKYPPRALDHAEVRAFRDWLMAEAVDYEKEIKAAAEWLASRGQHIPSI